MRLKPRNISKYFIGAAIAIPLGVAVMLAAPWVVAHTVPVLPPSPAQVITNATQKPDERLLKISDDEYAVAADQPRMLKIPSSNVAAYIQRMGTDSENRIAAPTNVGLAGWFIESARPGDNGLSIIDGHVSGRYKPGVFKELAALKPGDEIVVEFGDMSKRTFSVVSFKTVSEKDAAAALFEHKPDIKQQLNLITCASFDPHSKSYKDRLIVVATLKS